VANFASENDTHLVVLCGGETQKKSFPGKTEAGVMFDSLSLFLKVPYLLEGDSYTTYENIKFSAKRIRQWLVQDGNGKKCRITIFCEAQRALKVVLLARHFMLDLVENVDGLRIETDSWERADPARELKTTIMTWLGIKFPSIARQERDKSYGRSHNR